MGGNLNFVCLLPEGVNVEKGDSVKLLIDGERLHFFDGETRLTLLSRDGGYIKTGCQDADFKPMTYPEEQAVIEKHAPKKDKDAKGRKLC